MTDEEKLMWMFEKVHVLSGGHYAEVVFDEDDESLPVAVAMMKNGRVCWTETKADLVFNYLTRHL